MQQPLCETAWRFLTELNTGLPDNPAIALLDVYPNKQKTCMHTKTWTQIFIAALFILAKTWRQMFSRGEWINPFCCIHIMACLISDERKRAIEPGKDMQEP